MANTLVVLSSTAEDGEIEVRISSSGAISGGLTGKESQGKDTSSGTMSGGLTGKESQGKDTLSGTMSGGLTGKESQGKDTSSGAMSGGLTGKESQSKDTSSGAMSGGLTGKESQSKDTSSGAMSGGLTGKESQSKDTSSGAMSGGLTGKEKRNKASENNHVAQNTRKAAAIPKEVGGDILAQYNQFSPLRNEGKHQPKQKNNVQPNILGPVSSMRRPKPPDMFSYIRFSLKTKFSCNICNIKIDSYVDVLNHMMSEAHQRSVALKADALSEKMARKDQRRKELSLKNMFKKLSEEDKKYIIIAPDGKLTCEPCAKSLYSPEVTHEHLASKFHAKFKKSAEFTKLCKDNFILQVEVSHWQCSVCKSLSDPTLKSVDSVFHHVKSDSHETEMKHWQEQNTDVPLTEVTLSEAGEHSEYKQEQSFNLTISTTNVPKETETSAKLMDESGSTVVSNESNRSEAALRSALSTIVGRTEVGVWTMCNGARVIDAETPQKLSGKSKSSIEASKLANGTVHKNVTITKSHTDVNVPSVVLINALDNVRFSKSNTAVNVDNTPWVSMTNEMTAASKSNNTFAIAKEDISSQAMSVHTSVGSRRSVVPTLSDGGQSRSSQAPSRQCLINTAMIRNLQQFAGQKRQSSPDTRSKDSEIRENVALQLTRSKDRETRENVAPQLTRSKDRETSEYVALQLTRSKDRETSENVALQLTRSKDRETRENVALQLTRSKDRETRENVALQLTRSKDRETRENVALQLTRSKDRETSENVALQLTRSKDRETSENVALQLTRSKDRETRENVALQLTRSKDRETRENVAPQLTRSKDRETSENVALQLTRSKDRETSENVALQLTRSSGHKKHIRKLIRRNFRNLHNSFFMNAPDLLLSSKSCFKPFSEDYSKCKLCREIIPLDLDAYISHVNIDKHKTRLQAHRQTRLSINQHYEILKALPGCWDSNKFHLKLYVKTRITRCRLCKTDLPLDYNEYHSHVTGPKHTELLQKFEVKYGKNRSLDSRSPEGGAFRNNKQSPRTALLSALTSQKRSEHFLCEQEGNSSDSYEGKEALSKDTFLAQDEGKCSLKGYDSQDKLIQNGGKSSNADVRAFNLPTRKEALSKDTFLALDEGNCSLKGYDSQDKLIQNGGKSSNDDVRAFNLPTKKEALSKDTFLALDEGKCSLKGYDSQDKLIQNGGKSSNNDVRAFNLPTKKEALSKDGSPNKSVQKPTLDPALNAKMKTKIKRNKTTISEDLDLTLHPDVCAMLKSRETLLDHCSQLGLLSTATSHPHVEQHILCLLEDALKPAFGEVRATLFGSRSSGLALPGSDLDIFIDLGKHH
uniref:(California timema) hypothetical protein n=1 Tax=Timema californicum TaxID=61474 RepID=A0A7R9JF05_TIMCA|nr:unnamed protein product [Timema californicum]